MVVVISFCVPSLLFPPTKTSEKKSRKSRTEFDVELNRFCLKTHLLLKTKEVEE